jgi:hypothetical protein
MLDKLNDIDWQALGEPRIPTLFQQMQSTNREEFLHALNELMGIVVPVRVMDEGWGGSLLEMAQSEVPYRVTPFLVEMFQDETDPFKQMGLLELLHDLCVYWNRRTWIPKARPERASYEHWARQINDAVRVGIPLYQKLLVESHPKVREAVQELLDILEKTRADQSEG